MQHISGYLPKSERAIWGTLLLGWFLVLCFVPDPRPLAAPEWAVSIVDSMTGFSEPAVRAIATVSLRAVGIVGLGILVSMFSSSVFLSSGLLAFKPTRWAMPLALLAAPLLGVMSFWVNYGYFPLKFQFPFAVVSATLGALIGLAIRRSRVAAVALVVLVIGLFTWATSTGISDEVDLAARAIGRNLLEHAAEIPKGDEGFAASIHAAFTFAEENSIPSDAVMANKAAIVALGVILGDEQVARVAKRSIDPETMRKLVSLRGRMKLRGRNDLSRHFWVSATLAVLSDESRSLAVGIAKEKMDAAPGGSGFSFIDLAANRAGIQFAVLATRDMASAQRMQERIRQGLTSHDFLPEIADLPEGITSDQFQRIYGGLGGTETQRLAREIERRLATCAGLVDGR